MFMKLNEAKEVASYYLNIFHENPAILTDIVDWKDVKEKLKTACRVLDDPSQIQAVLQLINAGEVLFNNVKRGVEGE
jgi:hypothetical protein